MDKQIIEHPYNGILLSDEKKWTTATYNDMDEYQMHDAK